VLCLTDFKGPSEYTQPQQPTKAKPALFWEHNGQAFVSSFVTFRAYWLFRIEFPRDAVCTTESLPAPKLLIERLYREETGYKMPNAIKRVLLPKRRLKRKSRWNQDVSGSKLIQGGITRVSEGIGPMCGKNRDGC